MLVGGGIALGAAIAYTAVLFANAVDHQVAKNTRLSPKGGYYDRR